MTGDTIPRRIVIKSPADATSGLPPLRIVMERSENAAAVFRSPSDRNRWYRAAWQGVGQYWIDEYLPLRWIKAYAVRQLGYTKGGYRPFYDSGQLKALALSGARAVARATSTRGASVTITIPAPPYVNYNKDVQRYLRVIPAREILVLAKVLKRNLILYASEATVKRATRGPTAGQVSARFAGPDTTDAGRARRSQRQAVLNRRMGIRERHGRASALNRMPQSLITRAQQQHTTAASASTAGRRATRR